MRSTFSCYYLNQKAKDLASLMTIEDRGRVGGGIIQEDDVEYATIPDRKSKTGDK